MRLDPQRESRSFDEVYADELPYVWSCLRSLGVAAQDLEDAAQDVFVVVHRRLPEFRGEARLRTWLFSIAVRVASRRRRDGSRAERRRTALVTRGGGEASEALDPEEVVARQHASARLERFTATLDADKQRVFELWALEGRSPQDIADALELPRNTVYSRLRVVRQSFSELCARYHARDEARMSARHRRERDAAQARIRAAIVAGPLVGPPDAATGAWWSRAAGLGAARVIEVGAAIGLATVVVVALGGGLERGDGGIASRTSDGAASTSTVEAGVEREARLGSEANEAREATPGAEAAVSDETLAAPDLAPSSPARALARPASQRMGAAAASSASTQSSTAPTGQQATTSPDATASAGPSLDRAVALIHAAREALAAGDLPAADEALRRHAQDFPRGPLEQEREAYAAMLACARGELEPGRRFVAAHADTRLGQRVSATCALEID